MLQLPRPTHGTFAGGGPVLLVAGRCKIEHEHRCASTRRSRARLLVPRVMAPQTSPEPATQGSKGFGSRRKSVDCSITKRVVCQRPAGTTRPCVLSASGSDAFCRANLTGRAADICGDSLALIVEAGRGRNSARGANRCTIKTLLF